MQKKLIFLLFSLIISEKVLAQAKYSNEFMAIGVGAQALGMANARIASIQDVTSGYWNPAGLTRLSSDFQFALMHSEYFAGIAKYDYGAFATPIDSTSTLGISIIRFGVDNIPNTTELIDANGQVDYNRIYTFSAADYGFIFSYAKKASGIGLSGLSIGANAKIIRRVVGNFAGAWGFGLDAGVQYQTGSWQLGIMARDITTTFNAWSFNLNEQTKLVFQQTGNEIPENSLELTLPKLIMGGGKTWNFKKFSLLSELNLDATFDGKRNVLLKSNPISLDPHLGIELGYTQVVYVRGGVGNIQQIKETSGRKVYTMQPNLGVGVKIKAISIDYALTNVTQTVGLLSNVFSLKVDLNRKPKSM